LPNQGVQLTAYSLRYPALPAAAEAQRSATQRKGEKINVGQHSSLQDRAI